MRRKVVSKSVFAWAIFLLCILNLVVMHYYIFNTCYFECNAIFVTFVDNIFGMIIDLGILFLLFYFLTFKSQKAALTVSFFVTLCWSFCNVLYSRFFHHYLSLSAICQGDALADSSVFNSVVDGLRWTDLYYILAIPVFFLLLRRTGVVRRIVLKTCSLILAGLVLDFLAFVLFGFLTGRRNPSYIFGTIESRHFSTFTHLVNPNDSHFRRGSLRTLFYEVMLDLQGTMELTDEQLSKIQEATVRPRVETDSLAQCMKERNLIFVLVESYMSFVSDMTVNGQEVTPFLNALKRDSTVYYNGEMNENVTIGESSDGQFIYMTGLLPLRSIITVSKARNITLPGLPKVLGRHSRMVIPTTASLWNQDEMCGKYGIDSLFTNEDFGGGELSVLNDEQVLQLVMQKGASNNQPFFSLVLTMSMHQPYTQQLDPSFPLDENELTRDLACYLNVCHYTDGQLKKYFDHLKHTGVYDNSLIVIAADHPAHNTDFGGKSKHIPLYLVNIPQEMKAKMWQGACNQVDVYPTLLDLMGITSDWRGLGTSLLAPHYSDSIPPTNWDISEWIIRGDFFGYKQ